eukprot:CAMPEP_0185779662 /NCGR_PEP_ID=MMETSP1174-20130828/96545_1 /TAXON_ID=35687 /ORGANISM="Dictyocha speculum, Strain CCMP1381" /LENGTH=50 /DNA_ID=CAMNT_0028468881 /DNA_START=19 /DNA_END=171 /DNA_ORIENTATION=+
MVHIGTEADASQATSYVSETGEVRKILRAFASVSKKDKELRILEHEETTT